MSTTVPQNIKGCQIAGSHVPSRASLRHSRMLVGGKKSYQGKCAVYAKNFRYTQIQSKHDGLVYVYVSIHIFFMIDFKPFGFGYFWS